MEEKIKKERKIMTGLRGVTRLYAVQVLYKVEILGLNLADAMKSDDSKNEVMITENESLYEIDAEFFQKLMEALNNNSAHIDQTICKYLTDKWKIERLDIVLKNIIRLGITELLYFPENHKSIIFNEYVEIAKSFFETEPSFVNALLNSVAENMEERK